MFVKEPIKHKVSIFLFKTKKKLNPDQSEKKRKGKS